MANNLNSGNPNVDLNYRRRKNAEEMKYQMISFALMIFLTVIAFFIVGNHHFTKWFIIPVILLMAAVQFIFQLFYFMHMSHKGHETPKLFMFTGLGIGMVIVFVFSTILWW